MLDFSMNDNDLNKRPLKKMKYNNQNDNDNDDDFDLIFASIPESDFYGKNENENKNKNETNYVPSTFNFDDINCFDDINFFDDIISYDNENQNEYKNENETNDVLFTFDDINFFDNISNDNKNPNEPEYENIFTESNPLDFNDDSDIFKIINESIVESGFEEKKNDEEKKTNKKRKRNLYCSCCGKEGHNVSTCGLKFKSQQNKMNKYNNNDILKRDYFGKTDDLLKILIEDKDYQCNNMNEIIYKLFTSYTFGSNNCSEIRLIMEFVLRNINKNHYLTELLKLKLIEFKSNNGSKIKRLMINIALILMEDNIGSFNYIENKINDNNSYKIQRNKNDIKPLLSQKTKFINYFNKKKIIILRNKF